MAGSSAGRHVQLVGGGEAQFRITYLPPPLMSDDRSLDGAWRWFSILYVSNRSRRHQDQHEHDQDRQDGPGKFDLIASVNLWRLARFISGAVSKTDEGIDEQTGNNDEDNRTDGKHQDRCLFDLLSGLGQRSEDAGDAVDSENRLEMALDDDPQQRHHSSPPALEIAYKTSRPAERNGCTKQIDSRFVRSSRLTRPQYVGSVGHRWMSVGNDSDSFGQTDAQQVWS